MSQSRKEVKVSLEGFRFFLLSSSLDLFYGILLYYKTDDEELLCCIEKKKKMLEMRKNLDLYCLKAFYT